MWKINEIIEHLKNHTPIAVNRFNDGEMHLILKTGITVSRGTYPFNEELSDKLKDALCHEQEYYYKGIPCEECFPSFHREAVKLINPDYAYTTHAVIMINRNYQMFRNFLIHHLRTRNFHYVHGSSQNVENLIHHLQINQITCHRTLDENAWQDYDNLRNLSFEKGSVVGVSCGAAGRVLVHEWFKKSPDSTFLELGSFFDPITRNLYYKYHMGTLKPCSVCN